MLALALTLALSAGDPDVWAPPHISSAKFESHAAFDPWDRDLYFVRSEPDFSGWRILVSRCGPSGWGEPADAPFAGDGVDADPFFSDGGRRLWFISTRSTDGAHRKDLDIWTVTRTRKGGWGVPRRMPAPVNSPAQEWFPRPSPDGWLYFGSGRRGGLGKTDIWRARERLGQWTVENLGPAINGPADEYEATISPDGRRMLLMTSDGYYESRRTAEGWSARVRLGPEVNANGSEVGALFSPSGRSWLVARDLKDGRSGEFIRFGAKEAWPPRCPVTARAAP